MVASLGSFGAALNEDKTDPKAPASPEVEFESTIDDPDDRMSESGRNFKSAWEVTRRARSDCADDTIVPMMARRPVPNQPTRDLIILRQAYTIYKVLCVSADWRSLPMWAHHSQGFSGFVLEFDASHSFFADAQPVNYVPKQPQATEEKDITTQMIYFTKHECWKYEEEWRLLKKDSSAKAYSLIDLPPEVFRSILVGYKASPEAVRRIVWTVRKNPMQERVNLEWCGPDPDNWSLHRWPATVCTTCSFSASPTCNVCKGIGVKLPDDPPNSWRHADTQPGIR